MTFALDIYDDKTKNFYKGKSDNSKLQNRTFKNNENNCSLTDKNIQVLGLFCENIDEEPKANIVTSNSRNNFKNNLIRASLLYEAKNITFILISC